MHAQFPRAFALTVLLFAAPAAPLGFAAETPAPGSVAGAVSNQVTRNLLKDATVALPDVGLSVLTDETGRYALTGVPAGVHPLVVSYEGLDPVNGTVTVAPGEKVERNFALTTEIYKLNAYQVSGEREGMAAALTEQRALPNVENVVSMDSVANLPNMNASEIVARLPGVAGNPGDEVMEGLTIRGMGPGLNTITMDGGRLSSFAASTNKTRMQTFTGEMFEGLQLTKAATPDAGVDSLGGTVNLTTRSPLSMQEDLRVDYSFLGRLAPSFLPQEPLLQGHRFHPLLDAAYQQVFSIGGGERNFGIAVNLFYSENVFGAYETTRDYQNTTAQPAYLWDFRMLDDYNNRIQASVNVKLEYRLSPTTKFTFNTIYNDHSEPLRHEYTQRLFSAQSVGTTGTGGILPGYTNRFDQARASTSSDIDVTGALLNRLLRTRQGDFGGEHHWGPVDLSYHAVYGETHYHDGPNESQLVDRITNIGWTVDRTKSDLYPTILQTEGADFSNAANYRPSPNGLTSNAGNRDDNDLEEARADLRYRLPVAAPVSVKVGGLFRQQNFWTLGHNRRWTYAGTTGLAADPTFVSSESQRTPGNTQIPTWQAASQFTDGNLVNPSLWTEDNYFREQSKFTGTHNVREDDTAGYALLQGKVLETDFVAGVRTEKTEINSWNYVPVQTLSTAAQQLADPVGSALHDYQMTVLQGSYTKSFPSIHLARNLLPDLKARLSWSTSFSRPPPLDAVAAQTGNATNGTLTISNPNLKPQNATNWDASLDYYLRPLGHFSVGFFQKTIKDYIVAGINNGTVGDGPNNGYGGQYGGYTILTTENLGAAYVQGYEFDYQEQFSNLPGLLRTLSLTANYTWLTTHGDYGGTTVVGTGAVPGFIPKTGNAGFSWRYGRFGTRAIVNWTGTYLLTVTAGSPGRNQFFLDRTVVNVGVDYRLTKNCSLSLNVDNPFNEHQRFYRGIPDQMQLTIISGTTATFGVTGQF